MQISITNPFLEKKLLFKKYPFNLFEKTETAMKIKFA